jgi:hypothetical protein
MKKTGNTIVGIITFMVFGMMLLGGAKLAVNAAVDPNPEIPIEYTVEEDEVDEVDVEAQLQEDYSNARDNFAVVVYDYIMSIAPRATVDPYILIDLCTEYNIDVAFVLAQGQIESHYATKGTAARTNSIFNVGAYDGHSASRQCRNGFGFADPNDSIEPYLMLLTNDYLVNGKTINDLMVNYVNKYGMRYASNRKYESQLRSVYNKIYRNPNFKVAYTEYKECYDEIC